MDKEVDNESQSPLEYIEPVFDLFISPFLVSVMCNTCDSLLGGPHTSKLWSYLSL